MTRTKMTILALGIAVSSVSVLAQNTEQDQIPAAPSARRTAASQETVQALLAMPVDKVDWQDNTFEEVLDWLRDKSDGKVNIIPRWTTLADVDVDPDKLVTLNLMNTSVQNVLDEVLSQLNDTGDATYRGEGNILRISTKQDFNRKLEMRIYDVTDILLRIPDFSESAPQIDLDQAARQGGSGGGGGGGGQGIFRNAGGQNQEELSEEGEQDPERILNDLVTLIRDTIEPTSWDGDGGGPGRIRGFGKRSLVVYNTPEIHEMIAGFFSRSH